MPRFSASPRRFGPDLSWACFSSRWICRTIAFEVGMQNGGMAAGLAMDALKSSAAALAPAIFGPWMNISGSLLASWWKNRPEEPEHRGLLNFGLE